MQHKNYSDPSKPHPKKYHPRVSLMRDRGNPGMGKAKAGHGASLGTKGHKTK